MSSYLNIKVIAAIGAVSLAIFYGLLMSNNMQSNTTTVASVALDVDRAATGLDEARESVHADVMINSKAPIQQNDMEKLKYDLIEKLQQQYGQTIQSIAVQASLKDLLADLLRSYPNEGRGLFESLMRGAFPDYADEILSVVSRMEVYDEWLLENALTLNELNHLEYQGTLWRKREELFGDQAKLIWSSEITAKEERRKVLQKTVAMLDTSYETTMYERVYILKTAFDEQYADSMENLVYDGRGVLSQVMFGFDSVQKELSALEPVQRQEEINEIRRQLGFDEQSINYLEKVDQDRETRWRKGYAYMAERDALIARLEGEELNQAMTELRVKYFKHEAPTIAQEEKDEFFRFKRPRFYGRN